MLGEYANAVYSWVDAKTNIRHGEVVDYESLHLNYMLCKSEIALNIAIAYYYTDMTDECNFMLDEARGYTIVKDNIDALTERMINGEDIYPCTIDDTMIFTPPKVPQSVLDAMRKGISATPSSGSSTPASTSSSVASSPAPSAGSTSSASSKASTPARGTPQSPASAPSAPAGPPLPKRTHAAAPPERSTPPTAAPAPTAPALPSKSAPAAKKAGNPPLPPSKTAAPGVKPGKAAGVAPAAAPALPPRSHGQSASSASSTQPTSPRGNASSDSSGAPPAPPIPPGGVQQKVIPTSEVASPYAKPAPSAEQRQGFSFTPNSIKDALAKKVGISSEPNPEESAAKSLPSLPPASQASPPAKSPSPPAASGVAKGSKFGAKAGAATQSSAPVQTPAPVTPALRTNNSASSPPVTASLGSSGPGTAFKILAEYGARKKKLEISVSSATELKNAITEGFGVPASTIVEYHDTDFGEYVELDANVTLSSLPTLLKARIPA